MYFQSSRLFSGLYFLLFYFLRSEQDMDSNQLTISLLNDLNNKISSESQCCPVSFHLNPSVNGILSYPIDIFDTKQFEAILSNIHYDRKKKVDYEKDWLESYRKYDMYNCTSSESHTTNIYHFCSKRTQCPIDNLHLNLATNRSHTWDAKHSLCYARDSLISKESITNVIILGGSVTNGAAAVGCVINPAFHSSSVHYRTSNSNGNPHSNHNRKDGKKSVDDERYTDRRKDSSTCRWSTYLMNWLKSYTLGTINEIFLSDGGQSSPYMSELFAYRLHQYGITSLTKSDIIFIDYSVNDGMIYDSEIRSSILKQGLETLIRRILHVSETSSWPTIILLEMWPYPNTDMSINNKPKEGNDRYNYDYSVIYEDIAKEYQIPIWSYRDLVWKYDSLYTTDTMDIATNSVFSSIPSHAILSHKNQFNLLQKNVLQSNYTMGMAYMLEYLRFQHNIDFGYQHPPWYIHLFYADMIGALLLRELKQCSQSNDLSVHTRDIVDMNLTRWNTTHSHHIYEEKNYCREDVPNILDMQSDQMIRREHPRYKGSETSRSSKDTEKNLNYTHIGNIAIWPNHSWVLSEDKKGKTGWVDHITRNISNQHIDTCADGAKYASNITFTFNAASLIMKENRAPIFLIRIHYLKTYLNAGAVEVRLCGKFLTHLDALWPDYQTYHFSYPNIYTWEYSPAAMIESERYCVGPVGSYPQTLEIRRLCHPKHPSNRRGSNKEAEQPEHDQKEGVRTDPYRIARGKHRFQLISVKICEAMGE